MRRVIVQCREEKDITVLLEVAKEFGAFLMKPENPERFDIVHFDVPEDRENQVEDFQRKLMETIPYVAVKIF
ncbi:hypothetical protein T265_13845 [Opisthorchis viverrini]|uniref:Uncharacterized protein n=1 Tax=Opisthorchis viverrini TaxID=6198 RepID=A0A074ZN03_OPIVI|nr:hypothetical protein T265_13845 [Opisthorchis viverrini]KER27127.1 hypothetical protein T265_13845 [Opisthorchis viverrini]